MEQKQINDLPLNGRNFTDLVALVPGVSSGSQVGNGGANLLYGVENNFSVSGARSEGQAYLLDNTDIQGFWNHGSGSGVMGTTLGIEAIAEFSLLTNTYSAQFGGNGAVVNTASKSGTNSFHGSAYEFLRNSALDAAQLFRCGSTKASVPPESVRRQPGRADQEGQAVLLRQRRRAAQVPGPDGDRAGSRRQRAQWNRQRRERRRQSRDRADSGALSAAHHDPAPAASAPSRKWTRKPATRITSWRGSITRLSNKDSLFVRYVRDCGDTTLPFLGSPLPPRWPEVGATRNQFATIEYRRVISPTLVNLLRFSFTRTRETDVQAKPDQTPALDFFPERGQNGGVNITGLSSIGTSIFAPLLEVQNKFPLADDVIWTHGAHSLRFGGSFSRVQSNFQQQGWWGGFYTFPSLTAFLQGIPEPLPGAGAGAHGFLSRLPRNRSGRICPG